MREDKSKYAHKDCERHTETCRTIWWIIHPTVSTADTERVGSDSGGEGSSTFYLEMSEGVALIRETVDVEGTQFQSTFQSRISSLGVRIFRGQILDDRAPLATVFFPGFRPCRWLRSDRNSMQKRGRIQA